VERWSLGSKEENYGKTRSGLGRSLIRSLKDVPVTEVVHPDSGGKRTKGRKKYTTTGKGRGKARSSFFKRLTLGANWARVGRIGGRLTHHHGHRQQTETDTTDIMRERVKKKNKWDAVKWCWIQRRRVMQGRER